MSFTTDSNISPTTEIQIKYFKDSTQIIENNIIVPIEASLRGIWIEIQKQFGIKNEEIKLPVFTLLTTSYSLDWPDIIYFANDNRFNRYDYEFYSKAQFAKLIHHKINPMKRWRSNKYNRRDSSVPSNDIDNFIGDAILCVENSENLPQPNNDTIASQQWHESRKFSTIYIDDYTQTEEKEDEKQETEFKIDNIGSSNIKNAKLLKLKWRIPKGTSLERFYEMARKKCNIDNYTDIRAFRLYEKDKYLLTFPYKFQCQEHKLMLERGRYPKYTEVFLMVCLKRANNTTTEFLPLIINKSKSVKTLKQSIMKLCNLNPLDYKKYICYNITSFWIHQKDEFWSDSLTLNSNQINPRHGDRIGISMICKNISLMTDMRNLNTIWDSLRSNTNSFVTFLVTGYIKNMYRQIPNEIQHLIVLFYDIYDAKNPYMQQTMGTISIAADITLEQLRKQIYNMQQFENSDIKSHKYLLLSWIENKIPLSFPMLRFGVFREQKNFVSSTSGICVEILNEEMETIPKESVFLHIVLGKIEMKTDNNKNEINLLYWPDYHIRTIYIENNKQDTITSKNLSKFLCNKYNILSENLLIAVYRGFWILIDDQTYELFKGGLVDTTFVIFDLSKCNIKNAANYKEKTHFIKQNINKWRPPH